MLKTFTIDDIRSWKPCYDPMKHLPESWSGTAIDILNHDTIPPQDKLWVVCREELIDAKTLRLFGVWCARQVQHLMRDERSKVALDVAEKFAHGTATENDLAAAREAAWDAAEAAREAVWAAREAAWAAVGAAAEDAARGAARAAAEDAAWGAAWGAAAWAAAEAAAREAARAAQIDQLKKLLTEQ
jgi:hypothetical protein